MTKRERTVLLVAYVLGCAVGSLLGWLIVWLLIR